MQRGEKSTYYKDSCLQSKHVLVPIKGVCLSDGGVCFSHSPFLHLQTLKDAFKNVSLLRKETEDAVNLGKFILRL